MNKFVIASRRVPSFLNEKKNKTHNWYVCVLKHVNRNKNGKTEYTRYTERTYTHSPTTGMPIALLPMYGRYPRGLCMLFSISFPLSLFFFQMINVYNGVASAIRHYPIKIIIHHTCVNERPRRQYGSVSIFFFFFKQTGEYCVRCAYTGSRLIIADCCAIGRTIKKKLSSK